MQKKERIVDKVRNFTAEARTFQFRLQVRVAANVLHRRDELLEIDLFVVVLVEQRDHSRRQRVFFQIRHSDEELVNVDFARMVAVEVVEYATQAFDHGPGHCM